MCAHPHGVGGIESFNQRTCQAAGPQGQRASCRTIDKIREWQIAARSSCALQPALHLLQQCIAGNELTLLQRPAFLGYIDQRGVRTLQPVLRRWCPSMNELRPEFDRYCKLGRGMRQNSSTWTIACFDNADGQLLLTQLGSCRETCRASANDCHIEINHDIRLLAQLCAGTP